MTIVEDDKCSASEIQRYLHVASVGVVRVLDQLEDRKPVVTDKLIAEKAKDMAPHPKWNVVNTVSHR